jgi:orotate phosphoribosyltransferase
VAESTGDISAARARLLADLREHALVIGEVTLTSGRLASYHVDAKRAILLPGTFAALGVLIADRARTLGASAVGGVPVSAIPVACAALAGGVGRAFIVRKERKAHGLQRWIEGPPLAEGERCLIVEDVVTTGGSTIEALERVRGEGLTVVGVVSVLDRLAGGGEAIQAALDGYLAPGEDRAPGEAREPGENRAPRGGGGRAIYVALSTIDEVYPERPDR